MFLSHGGRLQGQRREDHISWAAQAPPGVVMSGLPTILAMRPPRVVATCEREHGHGYLFCRWIWNQFFSRLVGKLSTSVKRLPCEPSACTAG